MVDAITPVSATTVSSPTQIGTSTSIDSISEHAWVAARQSQITADHDALAKGLVEQTPEKPEDKADPDTEEREARLSARQLRDEALEDLEPTEQPPEPALLSGESERIGTQNFDEDTPFGERVAFI